MRTVTSPARISRGPVSSTSPAKTSAPASLRTVTRARDGTTSPGRGAGRLRMTRRIAASPGSTAARTGRASSSEAPSSARSTALRIVAASSRASDGASTHRAPSSVPRSRSISRSGHRRATPFASTRWTSGRTTPSRGPAVPPSPGMSSLRREAHREGPRLLRLRERAVPLCPRDRGRLQRPGVPRRVELVRRPDQELVGVGGLAGAEHVARAVAGLLLAHRLVEGRAAEDDEPAAVLHELPDRLPGLEGEGAAVRKHQHVVVGALQARRERGRRVERVDREARERRRQRRVVDGRSVGRREPGRAEERRPRRPGGLGGRDDADAEGRRRTARRSAGSAMKPSP